jgi:hypothetical protein
MFITARIRIEALLAAVIFVSFGQTWANSDDVAERWKDDAIAKIKSIPPNPTTDEIRKISGYLKIAERGDAMTDEQREVFGRVKETILGLPDHARFFEEMVARGIQNEFKEASGKGRSAKEPDLLRTFAVLKQLPSPQVVDLLGRLLEDDRDPWIVLPAGEVSAGRPPPNSHLAARTLNQIGIEGVPVIEPLRDDRDHEAARDQWKLWYAQVKAGNRTFRFKGDPREYNLDGPVPAVALATRPGKSDRAEEAALVARAADEKAFPWLAVGGALGLLLIAAGACLRAARRIE